MTDEAVSAQEADPIVVANEAETETPEAVDNTEGQVESQPAEGEGEEPEAEDVSPSKARRERRKAQMERESREKAELSDKLAQTEARLKRIEEAAASSQPPKEADFASYEEYQASLAAFHSMKAFDDRQRREILEEADGHKQQISARDAARQNELKANWQDQVAEAVGKYADFEKVVYSVPISDAAGEIISGSDVGADIAYYLGSHPAEAQQIATLNPLEQARRIGAIEARMSLPKANTTSQAPTPIRPVKGKAAGMKTIDEMSMDEYESARRSGKLK